MSHHHFLRGNSLLFQIGNEADCARLQNGERQRDNRLIRLKLIRAYVTRTPFDFIDDCV